MGWINSQGYNMIYKNGKEIREHRLIAEEALGVPIPEDILVHHIDGNKLNNDVLNLQLITREEHPKVHYTGVPRTQEVKNKVSQSKMGHAVSEETRRKISKTLTGRKQSKEAMSKEEHSSLHNTGKNHPMYCRMHSQESKQKMSEVQNTSGFFRVSKEEDPKCKQGFTWRYSYYQDRKKKSLYSIDLVKLEEKVKSKGLPWRIINKENAIQSMGLNCKYHSKRKGNVIGGISTCKWCGKLYEKQHNNQACCSKECQDKLTAENSAKSSMRHYYKHKIGNTNKKAITSLGSKGTSSTTKPKENAEDEHEWAVKEARRLGFNIKKGRL